MTSVNKVVIAEVALVVLLSLSGRALCRPSLQHAKPATSYSYFSMALPHHRAAEPVYVSHHALHRALHHAVDEHDDEEAYHHEEPVVIAHPKYEYKYGVEDHHTGDYKDAKEERDGDVVKGEYSLLQPDGRKRTVHYTASKHGGFNAIVSYSGHAIHPEVKKAEPVHGHY
ncbi:cuticle protein 18.6-like isoform X3 [Thrips palmi]|uniref:Cuticle protein 18.6-like isoform X3 n=1 Tax=Thrips palmi TaxID=161013 RepID=A0A6P8YRB4_THRPL|nr:cuticle protein 18.6-like isoform X3 [Thrips palmi]